ncbi:MAG: Fis family transcriptional regulator [Deltaproteobacteria bacterium SM23_61]|nr:MAG: Fis family transcriptional regulator [Deltaproteobacteria bacterium SM23_61]
MERILVVDDDPSMRYSLNRMLEGQGLAVSLAKNGIEALEQFAQDQPDLVVMDIKMPGQSGLEVLKEIKERDPKALVILMTAFGTTETAIEAMKFGAFDYILKPFDIPQMRGLVGRALEVSRMMKKMVALPDREKTGAAEETIVGSSPVMQQIYKMIGQVAPTEVTALLRGESGTGKELVARAIYHHSRRADKPFLPVNCAAIPETLLESELFGHEKGSFTGALTRRIGKFEQGHGGTIFLDEIGDMTPATQAKILRVLQDRQFERLGGSERITVDLRLIVATNKDLEKAIRDGSFRQDLYYRLKVVSIHLPPLRERKEDIPELVRYFLQRFRVDVNREVLDISPKALEKLMRYPWPGNVRELENAVKRAMVIAKGQTLLAEDFLLEGGEEAMGPAEHLDLEERLRIRMEPVFKELQELSRRSPGADLMSELEKILIKRALQETKGNQVQAAVLLGISRNTLRSKIERYRIRKDVSIVEEE